MGREKQLTIKRDIKIVTYTVGLLFASYGVFYTTFEMTLKLIIHFI